MTFSSWLIIIFLLLLTLAGGVGCRSFFAPPTPPAKVKIADSGALSPQWLEIVPPTPLTATAKVHFIGLKVKGLKNLAGEDNPQINFTDGRQARIEVELVDEKGRVTRLHPNGLSGESVEFGKRAENRNNVEEAYFQSGEKFAKVRLRSDKNIDFEEIVWKEFEF